MSEIRTTDDFNKLLDSCYFHPERVYPSEAMKIRARIGMTLLWNASELKFSKINFKQEDVRRILIDEMMPEDLDRAVKFEEKANDESTVWDFAILIFKCILFRDALVNAELEASYIKPKVIVKVRPLYEGINLPK